MGTVNGNLNVMELFLQVKQNNFGWSRKCNPFELLGTGSQFQQRFMSLDTGMEGLNLGPILSMFQLSLALLWAWAEVVLINFCIGLQRSLAEVGLILFCIGLSIAEAA